jgi:hypothetical protein
MVWSTHIGLYISLLYILHLHCKNSIEFLELLDPFFLILEKTHC